jgi:hypothetical protein
MFDWFKKNQSSPSIIVRNRSRNFGELIEHEMISEEFTLEPARFRSGELTGTQVYELGDGVLVDDMLTDEGNRFTRAYFDFKTGQYMKDYDEILSRGLPTQYHVKDTKDNYERIKQRINQRYEVWKKSQVA